jgi:DNA-binding transcriptional LysR family regulator
MRGTDYVQLRAFAEIVEQGSFARAAQQLGVSPSALSQIIRGLEERVGVRLLNRTTRSVAVSEAGERFLARVGPALRELDEAQNELANLRGEPSGLLRINTPREPVVHLITPKLGAFTRKYPAIVLDLVTDDLLADIVAQRFDAGIRLGETLDRDMVAVPLTAEVEMMVVAAPSYLKQYGAPLHPKDLAKHRCINLRWPSGRGVYRWEFERGRKKLEVDVEGPLTVNNTDVAVGAVLQGVGLAYLFDFKVQSALEEGRLVRVLEKWTPPFPGFYLYHPSRRQTPPALRAFIEFFRYRAA